MSAKNKEQLELLNEMISSIDPNLPAQAQVREEQAVEELARDIDDAETFNLVVDALLTRAKARHPSYLGHGERPTRPRELVGLKLNQLAAGFEQLREGKAPALIVRAEQYQDFQTDILQPLEHFGRYHLARKEDFPLPGNGLGHSRLHLDNFVEPDGSHFRYGMTVSRVTKGQVLFIAGLASKAAYGWNTDQYEGIEKAINASKPIAGLRERATDPTHPRGVGFSEWSQAGKGIRDNLIAVTLSPGDVAVWPQGGSGVELPAWHAFFQIGHPSRPNFEPRKSISYHLEQ